MSRHRSVHRHAGPRRRWHAYDAGFCPRHAAGITVAHAAPMAALPPAPTLAALVAPPLAVRPIAARPRGPAPYELAPPTQPLALTTGAPS